MGLVTGTLGVAAFFDSRRFAAASNAFIGVLLFGVLILLVLILGYQMAVDTRVRQTESMRRKIREAAGKVVAARTAGNEQAAVKVSIPNRSALFNRRGVGILLRVFEEMNDNGRAALRELLLRMGYGNFVAKYLEGSDNQDVLVEMVRMVAELGMADKADRVSALLYTYRDNVELQYRAFLTLSRLGSTENLVRVCMDKDFVQTLSFRSLQQILVSYAGNQEQLYADLLNAPDPYVVRICIKRIGTGNMRRLAPLVERWLDSDNMNLLIDTVRTLGALHYVPAAARIATLISHERWEVRGMAVTALSELDGNSYVDQFVQALQDKEWQVRYNAGKALRDVPDKEALRKKVQATGDKYALEMLEYMMQTAEMWRSA